MTTRAELWLEQIEAIERRLAEGVIEIKPGHRTPWTEDGEGAMVAMTSAGRKRREKTIKLLEQCFNRGCSGRGYGGDELVTEESE